MRILLVYAHPLDDSYCSALHQTVLASLTKAGHELRDIDLYAENFDPVLSALERRHYFDYENFEHNTERDRHISDLKWCEGLLFVYPTWWFSLPAMLKGWLDRIWLPDVAFSLKGDKPGIESKLQNIRLFMVITTYGSPWWVVKWVGDPGKKVMLNGLRPLCRPQCKTRWLALYKMDTIGYTERDKFLKKVARNCAQLA